MEDNNRVMDCPENLSSQLKPVYTITPSLSKISFNIVSPLRMLAEAVIFILEVTDFNLKRDPDCYERGI
jgi:hypothetical protein